LTPIGYRCKTCVRGQQKVFETAITLDYFLAVVIAGILGFIGSLLAGVMGFFTIFIAPLAGFVIAEAVRFAVHRRRSELLFRLSAGAAAIGSLPLLLIGLLGTILSISAAGIGGLGGFWGLLWNVVYSAMVTSTVYYRLKGIQIR
jgi:hypothetical protein